MQVPEHAFARACLHVVSLIVLNSLHDHNDDDDDDDDDSCSELFVCIVALLRFFHPTSIHHQ